MCPAMLADPAVLGEAQAGLPHSGIEPDIAHKLLGAGEALDVADRGNHTRGDREIDTGDGQQALHGWIVDRGLSDLPVEHAQVFAEPIKFAEATLDRHQLVVGQGLAA
jgi:hypothetical protein